MHEIGYVESLLPVLEQRAAGRRVTRVGVRAGVLHRLVGESFQQALELVAAGSVAEGATVELEQVPVEVSCRACGDRTTSDAALAACPSCGAVDVVCTGGDEFTLHWVVCAET